MPVKYTLTDVKDKGFHEDHWGIEILEGTLEGYIFQYDSVRVEETEDGGGATLHFNTITVNDVPNNLTDDDKRNIIGDILVDIIQEQIEHENRASDTEQPTT